MQARIIDIKRAPNGTQTLPFTVDYAKQHIRVDFTDDDAYITTLITQCIRGVENYCFISILPTTITLTVDGCGGSFFQIGASFNTEKFATGKYPAPGFFELPYGPMPAGVTSVSKINSDYTLTVLDSSNYKTIGEDFKNILISGGGNINKIIYNTGYAPVPDDLILAILNEVAFRMENRGDSTNRYASQGVGLSEGSQYLSNPFKRMAWL